MGEKKGNEGKSQDNTDEWGKTSSYPDSRTFDYRIMVLSKKETYFGNNCFNSI